jgi:hypothetical protein
MVISYVALTNANNKNQREYSLHSFIVVVQRTGLSSPNNNNNRTEGVGVNRCDRRIFIYGLINNSL